MKEFRVDGTPRPQGSKSAFKRGNKIVLKESSDYLPAWRKKVAETAREQGYQPETGPFFVYMEFIMPRTKAMKDKEAPPMTVAPDLDKLERAICDSLTGIVWEDDAQVIRINGYKRRAKFGEVPGVIIRFQNLTHPNQ